MIVAYPSEDLSTSCEEINLNAPHASPSSTERESVGNIHIGDGQLTATIRPHADMGEVREQFEQRFDALYPAQAAPLSATQRFPAVEEAPLTGLYYDLWLDRATARRISLFEGDLRRRWYVFRLNYGKGAEEIEKLAIPDCSFYIPDIKKRIKIKGKTEIVRETYLDHFIFAYTTRRIAEAVHNTPLLPTLRFYYNHFEQDGITGYNTPLVIPRPQMLDFMLLAEAKSLDKKILDPQKAAIRSGDRVEVTDGPFKGVQGILTRIAGKQRVVVDTGICILATGYISNYGYKKI